MNELIKNAFSLQGQNALITGGASGLGLAMAQCLASAGAKAIIVGTRGEEELAAACKEIDGESAYYQFDISKTDETPAFIEKVTKEHGHIDILINNAGVHCKKPCEQISIAEFQKVLDVHLLGSFALSQAVIPQMKERKAGNIIFISSMSALIGMTSVAAYSSAKTAMLGLTRSLSGEVASYNVRVNAIVPGFIDSVMFRKAVDGDIPRQQKILGRTAMNKYGDPMDIGWAAVYLCSPAASFITGVSLPVDGGCSIGF